MEEMNGDQLVKQVYEEEVTFIYCYTLLYIRLPPAEETMPF